jgi:hypothetical protein
MKHTSSSIKLACFLGLGALALVQGCGDDKNDKPDTKIPVDTGGKSTTGGKANDAGSTNTAGGTGASGTAGGTGATAADGGTGAQGGEGGTGVIEPPKCTLPERGTNDCFNCPTDNVTVEWLNRCVTGLSYDNAFDQTRVELLPADGKLPPFPN